MEKITFDIDEDEFKRLKRIAKEEDRSVGSVIRKAVRKYK